MKNVALFKNRYDAGKQLASELPEYKNQKDLIILGLPRGGIPVAYEIALELNIPLDIFTVRKLGVPGQNELAMGAVASGGVRVLNEDVIAALRIPNDVIDKITVIEQEELSRRERLYRKGLPPFNVENKIVMLVDDGLATGATMRAAINAVKMLKPAKVMIAVPIASRQAYQLLKSEVDFMECLFTPLFFEGVSRWYHDFAQLIDSEVKRLLHDAALRNFNRD